MTIPRETLEHLRTHYFEPQGAWARERIERVMGAIAVQPMEQVLDLGCANGTFSFHAARAGARPVGVDFDPKALVTGREVVEELGGPRTPRVVGDARQLPFRTHAFDVIINADFIEHTLDEDKETIFREMYRVMKPGGRGVVYTPNLARVQWEILGEHVKRFLGLRSEPVPHWRNYVDPDHFGLTTSGRTDRRLRRVGFRTEVHFFEFHVPFLSRYAFLNRLLHPITDAWFSNRFLINIKK